VRLNDRVTTEAMENTTVVEGGTPARRWEPFALLGILALAALLYCWALTDRSLQPYYAAAVRSLTESGRAFLFAGYDPAGVVSIDKTPLAFWVQGVGVWIFGYHWWAIALVQAIEGVASVFVLHRVVRRWAGERPALLAALVLAISPINTAIDRENQADALMVLLLLLAAYCVTRAVERAEVGAGTGWLVCAGVFVGLAFFAKMLAAWVVLPALAIAWLAAPVSWPKRVLRLLLSGAVCAVVSLAWVVFVSLWPASGRPFVGSTTDNSIWQLVFGYNGFGRVSGGSIGWLGSLGSSYGAQFSGAPGPLRLFGSFLGGQIGWLLPVALATVIGAIIVWARTRSGTPNQRAGWLLWSGWLVVTGLVFSFAGGIFHRYYTVELAPAIAALVGVGMSVCWGWYRAGKALGLLLPVAVLGTAGFAYVVLDRVPGWQPWLRPAIVVVGVVSAVALLLSFPGRSLLKITPRPAALVGIVAMLAGPLAFSVDTALTRQTVITAADPSAGPSTTDVYQTARAALGSSRAAGLYVNFMNDAPNLTTGQREVLDYVDAHAAHARVALGVELGSWGADPYLLNSTSRVVAFGGYVGLDPAPTPAQLADWASSGQLGYVLLPGPLLAIGQAERAGGGPKTRPATGVNTTTLAARIAWVTSNCAPVPARRIGPAAASAGVLFDCQH
jgi:4-amino-4-deoxy-L-arabinose transferase-like glycosyltransferase